MMRIGHGFDVHPLAAGRALTLGGVHIPHPKGLVGHSDADVLIHAVCDACLGAAALGDIGRHFPDSDARYKNIDSRALLRAVRGLIEGRGWQVENVDVTVVAEAPRLAPHVPAMVGNLISDLELTASQVNIKATTNEGLGYLGREEGIAAHAVVPLRSADRAESGAP
jgi:2-C-methyl-D-erythritol 2,4-cyclodiphosphate synthase